MKENLLAFLRKRKTVLSVEQIADHFDIAPKRVVGFMEELLHDGHNIQIVHTGVELSKDIPHSTPTTINVSSRRGKVIRIGITADNHLGSKYCRLDVLNALFDVWQKEGVTQVYQLGNMIDGEARFNKFDLIAFGIEGQSEYFAKHWPRRKGIVTSFITGDDHEGWYVQREGINIGKHLEATAKNMGRDDLVYLGHMEHDIVYKGRERNAVMRLIHAGGGSAYATSYSMQKIVESYQGGEKPNILIAGHYHKAEYGYPREVHVLQAGCTEDQTPFMRKNKIQAHVGGWIVEFTVAPDGSVTRFKTEWFPFFDKGHYDKAWAYHY